MNYSLKDIGHAIQEERDRRGLTQRSFASMAGTTQARVSNIENGEIDLRLSTLIEFARVLNLEFVLVPREHLPAVNSIIAQQPLSREEKSARATLNRLSNLIAQLKEQFPDNRELPRLETTAAELTNFRLTTSHIGPIIKVTDALKRIQATPALANNFDSHAASLRRLRNEIAHNISDIESLPRPAYHLDDEDDD